MTDFFRQVAGADAFDKLRTGARGVNLTRTMSDAADELGRKRDSLLSEWASNATSAIDGALEGVGRARDEAASALQSQADAALDGISGGLDALKGVGDDLRTGWESATGAQSALDATTAGTTARERGTTYQDYGVSGSTGGDTPGGFELPVPETGTREGEATTSALAQTYAEQAPLGAGPAGYLKQIAPTPLSADSSPLELGAQMVGGVMTPVSVAGDLLQAGAGKALEAIPGGETSVAAGLGVREDTPFLGGATTPDVAIPQVLGLLSPGTGDEAAALARSVNKAKGALEGAGRATGRAFAEDAASGIVTEAPERLFHGTANVFDAPDGTKFDPKGMFGPGYYLTDDPRVAASYADSRLPLAEDRAEHAQGLEGLIAKADQVLARPDLDPAKRPSWERLRAGYQENLDALGDVDLNPGQQMRAVDAPAGLRLLVAEEAVAPEDVAAVQDAVRRGVEAGDLPRVLDDRMAQEWLHDPSSGVTGEELWKALKPNDLRTPDANALANRLLADAGFDGIRYAGGRIMPIRDDVGRPVTHAATVIFPESLPKLKNALSGAEGGLSAGAAFRPAGVGARAAETAGERAFDLGVGTAGAIGGAATADEDATWQERAGRALAGAALGAPAGASARALGRVGRAVAEDAASGVLARNAADVEGRAVGAFGKTGNLAEAGYLQRDGSLLDFSGKRDGGSPGTRSHDHRQVGSLLDEPLPEGGTAQMHRFMEDTGAVRIDGQGDYLTLQIPGGLSPKQRAAVLARARDFRGAVVEVTDAAGRDAGQYGEFDFPRDRRRFNELINSVPEHVVPDEPARAGGIRGALDRALGTGRSGVVAGDEGEAERLRESLDKRFPAFEAALERLTRLEEEAAAGATMAEGALERPPNRGVWATAGRAQFTDNDLEEIAARSGVDVHRPAWYEAVDPEAVRIYRDEVMLERGAGEAEAARGLTPAQQRAADKAKRAELRQLRKEVSLAQREMAQDEQRLRHLEGRAGTPERAWESQATDPSAATAVDDMELPDWEQVSADADAARAVPVRQRTEADWEAIDRLERLLQRGQDLEDEAAGGLLGPDGRPLSDRPALQTPDAPRSAGAVLGPDGAPLPPTSVLSGRLPEVAPPPPADTGARQTSLGPLPQPPAPRRGPERTPATHPDAFPTPTGAERQAGLPGIAEGPPFGPLNRPPGSTYPGERAPLPRAADEAVAAAPVPEEAPGRRRIAGVPLPTLSEAASVAQSAPLSSPGSLWNNFLGGGFRTLQRFGQETAGGLVTQRPDKTGGEALADLAGMGAAVPEALAAALKGVREGPSASTGRGLVKEGAAGPEDLAKREGLWPALFTSGVRLNAATDQFWRTLNEGGGRARAAYRGLDELDAGEVATRAGDFATYFGQNSPVAEAMSTARRWVDDPQASPGKKALGVTVMALAPYVRTPERVLGAALSMAADPVTQPGRIWQGLREGNQEAVREAAGRMLLGSALWTYAATEYLAGGLVGKAPADPGERRRGEADGKVWNTWHGVPLRQLGTMGQAAGAIASTMAAVERAQAEGQDPGEAAWAGVGEAMRWTLDESFLRDTARFVSDVRAGRGDEALNRTAAGMVTRPLAPFTAAAGYADPYERDVAAAGKPGEWINRVPGGRYALPERRNEIGQKLTREGSGLSRALGESGAGGPEGKPVRQYVGSKSAGEDAAIKDALDAVGKWRRNPQGVPKPSKATIDLANRFSGRENQEYAALKAKEKARKPAGGGGGGRVNPVVGLLPRARSYARAS